MASKGEVRYRLTLDAKDFTSGIKVATKEFEGFVGQLGQGAGALGKVAGAMGPVGVAAAAAMGVATAGVVAFTKGTIDAAVAAVDFAGKISDLSTKTGISGEALQKLGFAGSLVGTSMESMGQAVAKMQQHMVKAPEDFKQLGLSMEKLKTLAPEKQFEAIGKAIQSIEDPAQRTAATLAIMGKGGQEAMKALSVDMEEAGRQAERLGIIMNDSTRQALDALGDSVTVLGTTWDHLLMNFGGAIAEMPEVKDAVDEITEALGEMSRFVLDNKEDIQSLVRMAIVPMKDGILALIHAIQFLISGLVTLKHTLSGGWLEAAGKQLANYMGMNTSSGGGGSLSATSRIVTSGKNKPPSWVDPAEVKKNAAEVLRIQKLADDTMAKIRVDAIKTVNAQLEGEYNRNVKVISQMLDGWAEDEKENAEMIRSVREQLASDGEAFMKSWEQQLIREHEALMQSLDDIQGLGNAIQDLGDAFGSGLISSLGQSISGFAQFAKMASEATTKTPKLTVSVEALASAYSGGVQSKSPGKGALQGAAKGAAAGSMFGPYGMIIGGAIGGIAWFFGGKKGQKQELAGLNAEIKQIQEAARQAGVALNVAFNPKNAQSMKTAIEEMNRQLNLQGQATDALHDAMDRYGISIGQLGPEFAKQELDQKAAQLLQDYQLLTAAGVDHNAVIAAMGPNLQEYVNMSLQAGTSIPEAMRPVIQAMIDQGLLLDQNGQAYTSVEQAGISFSQTMTEQFGTLISKINELVSALLGIPTNINTNINVNRNYTHSGDSGGDDGGRDGDTETPFAAGGIVTGPTRALIGEAGPEMVVPLNKGASKALGLGGLESKLDGLRDDFRRYQQTQGHSIRDAILLGRG